MSGHVHNTRHKLLVLAATGTFLFGSAATAAAATWPGGGAGLAQQSSTASASTTSSITPSGPNSAWQQTQAELARQRADAAAAAAAKKRAAAAAAAKAAAARAAAAKKAAAAAKARAAARRRQQAALQSSDPRQIAQAMLAQFGWPASQFSCLDSLWTRESNWEVTATNPSSGAYGIPQALPASKMGSAGSDWQTSAYTQIKWGLGYIREVYGSPCGAWSHETSYGWY